MSKFAEQSRKAFEAAGLFEPKTRAVKLRYSLKDIDRAQSHGASLEQIMKTLEASGLVFPSLVAFKMALTRARRAGPMANSAAQPSPEEAPADLGTGKRVAGQNSSTVAGIVKSESKLIRVERKERLTNPEPSMEDFV